MATRKQRRRREKEHRHEYEVVYVDDEGNEVEPEEPVVRTPARRSSSTSAKGKSGKGSTRGSSSRTSGRGRRAPQPPSWKRVAKRGALFFPLFVGVVLLLGGKKATVGSSVVQGLILFVFFVPFSYFLDSVMWRSFQKKSGGSTPAQR